MSDERATRLGSEMYGARKAAHVSREAIADLLGASAKTVQRYELGQTDISVVDLATYAEAVGTTVGELLRRAGLIPR